MKTSPTQRSLAWLRKQGWTVAVVEHFNPHVKIRQDLWGFGDLLCFRKGDPPLIVQTTSGSNLSSRMDKIRANAVASKWLEAGFAVDVHGWAKRGPRGEPKKWTLRRVSAAWNPGDNLNPVAFVEIA